MDSFKTYYHINEGIGSSLKKGVAAVAGAPGKAVGAAVGAAGDLAVPNIKNITTFEDLNKMIDGIITKARVGEVADMAIGVAVDQVIGLIPFAGNIKSGFDLLKKASKQPDGNETGSFIDKLDVDDQLSKIVDDPIEGKFLKFIQKQIKGKKGNIPPDWDINMELKQYLASQFGGRTVAGTDEARGNTVKTDPHLKAIK